MLYPGFSCVLGFFFFLLVGVTWSSRRGFDFASKLGLVVEYAIELLALFRAFGMQNICLLV